MYGTGTVRTVRVQYGTTKFQEYWYGSSVPGTCTVLAPTGMYCNKIYKQLSSKVKQGPKTCWKFLAIFRWGVCPSDPRPGTAVVEFV